jgi:hypothetical protein
MIWFRRAQHDPAPDDTRSGSMPGVEQNPYQSPATPLTEFRTPRKRRSRAMLFLWLAVGLAAGTVLGFLLLGREWWPP